MRSGRVVLEGLARNQQMWRDGVCGSTQAVQLSGGGPLLLRGGAEASIMPQPTSGVRVVLCRRWTSLALLVASTKLHFPVGHVASMLHKNNCQRVRTFSHIISTINLWLYLLVLSHTIPGPPLYPSKITVIGATPVFY